MLSLSDTHASEWGAAIGDEVAARVEVGFLLPMGIEREEKCE